jgi:hypothetical protein
MKTARPNASDLTSLAIAQAGAAQILTVPNVGYKNPYMPTSDNSDAFAIGAWCAYHTGKAPLFVHRSRGHSWQIQTAGFWELVVVVRKAGDHRNALFTMDGQPAANHS